MIKLIRRNKKHETVEYVGNYKSFEEAEKFCEGYDSSAIFDKVKESTLSVLHGKACYERDSYLFYEKAINYNLMMYLYKLLSEDNFLKICDFGGAMGSTFFQHREMLEKAGCQWNIVEQQHFVEFGKQCLESKNLHFYDSIEDIQGCNCFILSSVLQYLKNANEIIDTICSYRPKYIIIERTPVSDKGWFLTEKVHEPIYEASYACSVLNERELTDQILKSGYILIDSWHSLVDGDVEAQQGKAVFKSFVFELKIDGEEKKC